MKIYSIEDAIDAGPFKLKWAEDEEECKILFAFKSKEKALEMAGDPSLVLEIETIE
jgi:hypothetical protein